LFCDLNHIAEPVEKIAERTGRSVSELTDKLEDMAVRGLVFRTREGELRQYRTLQFFVGIIEAQINRVDEELAKNAFDYFPQLSMVRATSKSKQARILPVGRTIDSKTNVQSYNSLKKLISDDDLIAVAPCICRQMGDARERVCKHTRETCLSFHEYAQYYIDNGVGRQISKDELMKLLELAEDEGLVISTSNVERVEVVCLCCSCHCGVLSGLRMLPQNDFLFNTQYQAKIDAELCNACGTCVERCAINAIKEDEVMEVNLKKCVGCGLCASACPEEAIVMVETESAKAPFKSERAMHEAIARERGLTWPEK
jgi:ferredoxin/predicted transcriptional regulator